MPLSPALIKTEQKFYAVMSADCQNHQIRRCGWLDSAHDCQEKIFRNHKAVSSMLSINHGLPKKKL